MDWAVEESLCYAGDMFRVPVDGGALLERFAGRDARIDEVSRTRTGTVVRFTVSGVSISCPLAYLGNILRTKSH